MNDRQVRKQAIESAQDKEEQIITELKERLGREPTGDEVWAELEDEIESYVSGYEDYMYDMYKDERD